jgi:hypothetical protein
MKNLMVATLLLISAPAFADGFVCQTSNGDLDIKVYNNTDASQGTRTGAILVLSNPEESQGDQTIARFKDAKGTLSNSASTYTANVDLRFKDQSNKDALVAGQVTLADLDTVELYVAFSYAQPVAAGDTVDGELTLNTRGGDSIQFDVSCTRYLKN